MYFSGKQLRRGFTLVEVMLVVAILGFIIAIVIPTYFRSRELSRQRACQENLQKINGAKNQWALETNQQPSAEPDWSTLVGTAAYLRSLPQCPGGGTYTIGDLETDPECSLATFDEFPHVIDP